MQLKYNQNFLVYFTDEANVYFNKFDGMYPVATKGEIRNAVIEYAFSLPDDVTVEVANKSLSKHIQNVGKLLGVDSNSSSNVIGGVDFTDSIKALDSLGNDLVK